MNKNLDGSELSNDQLFAFAVAGGANGEALRAKLTMLHNDNMCRSALEDASAKARFAAFSRGELNLDTRTRANAPHAFLNGAA